MQRIVDITAGIQTLRDTFSSYWFDETNCAEGIRHLGLYRKQWNDTLGCWRETPREDGHQHAADVLRQKAQGYSSLCARGFRRKHRYSLACLEPSLELLRLFRSGPVTRPDLSLQAKG